MPRLKEPVGASRFLVPGQEVLIDAPHGKQRGWVIAVNRDVVLVNVGNEAREYKRRWVEAS